jgi:hypothetical protein
VTWPSESRRTRASTGAPEAIAARVPGGISESMQPKAGAGATGCAGRESGDDGPGTGSVSLRRQAGGVGECPGE